MILNKDENIVIDRNGKIQIIDFGSSAFESAGPFATFSGTAIFCSPEVLQGKSFTGKPQDIWALGILLYTLIYRENPFQKVEDILERDVELPFELSKHSSNLIQGLLCQDINERLDIDHVLNHEWLREC
jgi:serine/threonine protein kinase